MVLLNRRSSYVPSRNCGKKFLLHTLFPINTLISLFAFIAPYWSYTEITYLLPKSGGGSVSVNYTSKQSLGIWMTCYDGYFNIRTKGGLEFINEKKCETSFNNDTYIDTGYVGGMIDNTRLELMNISRSFMTVGTACVLIVQFAIIIFIIRGKGLRNITFTNILITIGGITTTVAVSIFGTYGSIVPKPHESKFYASFYLACISAGFCLFSTMAIAIAIVHNYSGTYSGDDDDEFKYMPDEHIMPPKHLPNMRNRGPRVPNNYGMQNMRNPQPIPRVPNPNSNYDYPQPQYYTGLQ